MLLWLALWTISFPLAALQQRLIPGQDPHSQLLTSHHIAALKLNEDIDLPASHTNTMSCCIGDIFNFESTHWIMSHWLSAVGSLEDEMELYNLLNLDASGDLDVDVDDCLASVFTVD